MKKAVSVLLMLLSVLIGFQRVIIVLHYQLNWVRIEQQYCENKNSVIVTCKGICYIKKVLEHTDEQANGTSKVAFQKTDIILGNLMLPYKSPIGREIRSNAAPRYKHALYSDPLIEIWDPPPIRLS